MPACRYDVIVLGDGPAAAAAATALARRGLAIALFAYRRGASPPIGETVPPSIIRPLVRLGLWETFVAARHRSSAATVVIWGQTVPFENEFIANPYGMGWHLDRERFDDMLLCAARDAGTDVISSVRLPDISRDGDDWILAVDETGAKASWIIDATGRASWFARRQGVRRHSLDRMVGLVRFGRLDSDDDRTFIEARSYGWWYAAGLPGNRVVVALFTDSDLLSQGRIHWERLLGDTELVSRVTAAAYDLSPERIVGASSGYLSECTGPGWLAVGDAAQSYDPCSGQGITKALESALAAAEAIEAYQAGGSRSVDEYCELIAKELRTFVDQRRVQYRRETRWPEEPFWRRRHRMV